MPLPKRFNTLTDEQYHIIYNQVCARIDALEYPKIKKVNPLKSSIVILQQDTTPINKEPLDDDNYALYLDAMSNPSVPTYSRMEGVYDYNQSVDWNLRGWLRYREDQAAIVAAEQEQLKAQGYNNRKKRDKFRQDTLDIFEDLNKYLYPLGDKDDFKHRPVRIKISAFQDISINRFLDEVLTTSSIQRVSIENYNPVFFKRAVRSKLRFYQESV